jgi:hypothetical protein
MSPGLPVQGSSVDSFESFTEVVLRVIYLVVLLLNLGVLILDVACDAGFRK